MQMSERLVDKMSTLRPAQSITPITTDASLTRNRASDAMFIMRVLAQCESGFLVMTNINIEAIKSTSMSKSNFISHLKIATNCMIWLIIL